jgi:hypothetical protein
VVIFFGSGLRSTYCTPNFAARSLPAKPRVNASRTNSGLTPRRFSLLIGLSTAVPPGAKGLNCRLMIRMAYEERPGAMPGLAD